MDGSDGWVPGIRKGVNILPTARSLRFIALLDMENCVAYHGETVSMGTFLHNTHHTTQTTS